MKSFFKRIFFSSALHDAIVEKDENIALGLIRKNFQIYYFYRGYDPLQLSLLYDNYQCAIELLEINADANSYYRETDNKTKKDKMIQTYVTGENISNVKMLASYGANIEGVSFREKNSYIKDVIAKANAIYEERKNLENSLKNKQSPDKKIKIYNRLGALWQSLAEDEKNEIYKTHYLLKYQNYKSKAETVSSLLETAPNTPESSLSLSCAEESRPLLSGLKFKNE